jgi:hypothetical protein
MAEASGSGLHQLDDAAGWGDTATALAHLAQALELGCSSGEQRVQFSTTAYINAVGNRAVQMQARSLIARARQVAEEAVAGQKEAHVDILVSTGLLPS